MNLKQIITRNYLPALAAALAGLSSCSQIYDQYDPSLCEEVYPLPLSVSVSDDGKMTKASDLTTFRGLESVHVLPFRTSGNGPVDDGDVLWGPALRLGDIGPDGLVRDINAYLYRDVYLRGGVNAVLAYGKAPDQPASATLSAKQRSGSLLMPALDALGSNSDIRFTLEPFLTDERVSAYAAWRDGWLSYLNGIVAAFDSREGDAFARFVNQGMVFPASKAFLDARLSELYAAGSNAVRSAVKNDSYVSVSGTKVSLLHKGPVAFGLPAGSVAFQYREGAGVFGLVTETQSQGVGAYMAAPSAFAYPPCLVYGISSPVKTSEDPGVTAYYTPGDGKKWEDVLAHYPGTAVSNRSSSVAVVRPLQYGVSRLDLTLSSPSGAYLSDSNGDARVYVGNRSYPLTGVLVAGQKAVGWNFHPLSDASETIVYDVDVEGKAYISTAETSQTVSVPLMETASGSDVVFAMEFLNDSGNVTFAGINGMPVSPGMHFYLMGKLELSSDSSINPDGLTRVMNQDRVTTAGIKVNSLKNAYTVLPDLREVQLSIGLDVQTNWVQARPVNVEIK